MTEEIHDSISQRTATWPIPLFLSRRQVEVSTHPKLAANATARSTKKVTM